MPADTLIPFDSLIGKEFDFFGVDGLCFKLGDTVYEALEDESDGYRSSLDEVRVYTEDVHGTVDDFRTFIFFQEPVAKVRVEEVDIQYGFRGYRLVDVETGHEWLSVGTDNYDDYYPMFRFDYQVPQIG